MLQILNPPEKIWQFLFCLVFAIMKSEEGTFQDD